MSRCRMCTVVFGDPRAFKHPNREDKAGFRDLYRNVQFRDSKLLDDLPIHKVVDNLPVAKPGSVDGLEETLAWSTASLTARELWSKEQGSSWLYQPWRRQLAQPEAETENGA